jgi:hypothetical protein
MYFDVIRLGAPQEAQAFGSLGVTQDATVGGVALGGSMPFPLTCFLIDSVAPSPFTITPWDQYGPDGATIFAVINVGGPSLKILLDFVFPNDGRKLIRMRCYGYNAVNGTVELLVHDLKLDWALDSAMAQSGMFLMTGHDKYAIVVDVFVSGYFGLNEVQNLKGGFTARVVA